MAQTAASGQDEPSSSTGPASDERHEVEAGADENTSVEELRDKLLRALADAENARKRADRSRAEGREAGMAELLSALAPALDNLELALNSATSDGSNTAIIEGLRATQRAISDSLARIGVQEIRPDQGDKPDHDVHDVIATVDDREIAPGRIVQVAQCGYKVGSRLVRPARIIVAEEVREG